MINLNGCIVVFDVVLCGKTLNVGAELKNLHRTKRTSQRISIYCGAGAVWFPGHMLIEMLNNLRWMGSETTCLEHGTAHLTWAAFASLNYMPKQRCFSSSIVLQSIGCANFRSIHKLSYSRCLTRSKRHSNHLLQRCQTATSVNCRLFIYGFSFALIFVAPVICDGFLSV